MFGGKKYLLTAHLIVSPEEKANLKRFGLDNFTLFDAEQVWGGDHIFIVVPTTIYNPVTYEAKTLDELVLLEAGIRDGCKVVHSRLKSADSMFEGGNETVIDFDD